MLRKIQHVTTANPPCILCRSAGRNGAFHSKSPEFCNTACGCNNAPCCDHVQIPAIIPMFFYLSNIPGQKPTYPLTRLRIPLFYLYDERKLNVYICQSGTTNPSLSSDSRSLVRTDRRWWKLFVEYGEGSTV